MLPATIRKNDKLARVLILIVSLMVFIAVLFLSQVKLEANLPFNEHLFALNNAILNSMVATLLVMALIAVKLKRYALHKSLMSIAIFLSVLFLLSYIAHHLFTGETRFGDANHDGIVSDAEKEVVGGIRIFYYIILLTHIPLAGIILPMILFTAYRGLTGEYERHKKLSRFTWPVWLYVAISGVIVYIMINPYYS